MFHCTCKFIRISAHHKHFNLLFVRLFQSTVSFRCRPTTIVLCIHSCFAMPSVHVTYHPSPNSISKSYWEVDKTFPTFQRDRGSILRTAYRFYEYIREDSVKCIRRRCGYKREIRIGERNFSFAFFYFPLSFSLTWNWNSGTHETAKVSEMTRFT